MEEIEGMLDVLKVNAFEWAKQIVLAVVIFWIGMRLVKMVMRAVTKAMSLREVDASLVTFLRSFLKIVLQAVVVIATINQLGVETTSIVAIFGAAGLAVGMALSGTLQNFAGGAMILMFKPFQVGDYIEAQGYSGTVKSIQIFTTILTTPHNNHIVIPNGGLSNSSLINHGAEAIRCQEWSFVIGYGDNIEKARAIIKNIIDADERVLREQEGLIELSTPVDSSVNILVRAWVTSENFWPLFYSVKTDVYRAFNAEGISTPFPQMDVHLQK